jgi:hypothetical protein
MSKFKCQMNKKIQATCHSELSSESLSGRPWDEVMNECESINSKG